MTFSNKVVHSIIIVDYSSLPILLLNDPLRLLQHIGNPLILLPKRKEQRLGRLFNLLISLLTLITQTINDSKGLFLFVYCFG